MKSVKKKVFDWVMSGAHASKMSINPKINRHLWDLVDQPPIVAEPDLHIWEQIRDGGNGD